MKAKVTFTIETPETCTKGQFLDWLKFNLGLTDEVPESHIFEYELALIDAWADSEILNTAKIEIIE